MSTNEPLKKPRQLSSEGLQVVTEKERQLSWEGLQSAVRKSSRKSAEGLQVVLGPSSPELVQKDGYEEKVDGQSTRQTWNRFLHAKWNGFRVIWIFVTVSMFVIGIAFGGAIVATVEAHAKKSGNTSGGASQGIGPMTSDYLQSIQSSTSHPLTTSPSTTTTAVQSHSSQIATSVPSSEISTTSAAASSSSAIETTSTSVTSDATTAAVLGAAATAIANSVSDLTDLQTFTGALGGFDAPPITNSGNATEPYLVEGETFLDYDSAVVRSCDEQQIGCADIANGTSNTEFITLAQCNEQQLSCEAAGSSATQTTF